jgi:acetyltransferase-like isoleucine patch superfamily enzyme
LPWDWYPGRVPENVVLHEQAYLETSYSFQLFRSQRPQAVEIGAGSSVYLGVMFDLGESAQVKIGSYVLMNGARIICDEQIEIGDYCLISWNTVLMDTRRVALKPEERRLALQAAARDNPRRAASRVPSQPVCIGNNVWIGFETCILPGVHIGDGSIIGARSVVTGDIPAYSVAVGNPARVIRTLDREARDAAQGTLPSSGADTANTIPPLSA